MAKADRDSAGPPPFRGFTPQTFELFEGIAAHQSRDWFQAHKADYEANVQSPLRALIDALALAFAVHDIPLTGDAKRSLFRVHRDVRFSNDKSPYKTHASAVMSRDGAKSSKGILYLHIGGPERTAFMAAGFYGLEPADLDGLRRAVADAPGRWRETESALSRAGLSLSRDDALVRMPKGYEALKDDPLAEVLKLRNFIVNQPLAVERLYTPDVIDDVLAFVRNARPLLDFGWRAFANSPSASLARAIAAAGLD